MRERDSFAALCREADKKQRRKPVDPHLELLRKLMANDVSLAETWYVLNSARVRGRAAASTVEALMHSLRSRGVKALDEPDSKRRISEISEEQLHEVGGRLQRLKPEIAKAWTAAEIGRLVETWVAHHA
jgi:hypothetical protein